MIEIFEDEVRKVVLGEGTTYISQVIEKGETASSGIIFTNTPPVNNNYAFKGDEVIIEITNFQGVISYLKAGIELLKTWKPEGVEEQLNELSKTLEVLTKK